jgi:hypothetical protein
MSNNLIETNLIYGLYAIPEGDLPTIHAISLSKEVLQDILIDQVPDEFKQIVKWDIHPIQTFIVCRLLNLTSHNNDSTIEFVEKIGTNLMLMPLNKVKLDSFENKIFGFNKVLKNSNFYQTINYSYGVSIWSEEYTKHLEYINSEDTFNNNVSENPIQFDQYYDEGIMNA